MKIKAFSSRYELTLGEGPAMVMPHELADDWYGRDPFEEFAAEGISENLVMPPEGTTDGHNTMRDSTFMDSMRLDKYVPISPLFVKDLTGRSIYIGFGPERKTNLDWMAYMNLDGEVAEDELNPFVPLCVFPRYCRDVSEMEGKELLEQVFLTKFRCLEMSMGYNGQLSGADEDDPLVSASYVGANLYPYKLRLDTFYIDGWKLPQTQMLYARGEADGVNTADALRLGEQLLQNWNDRAAGTTYEAWMDSIDEAELNRLYMGGCTLIPTFEACNGYHVVGPNFELEDYWPGRNVLGLHDVVEVRGDRSPRGTILEVLEPGFVTANTIRPAKVIISDGTGYVSPNATDPLPLVPNLNLPHPRTIDDWRATWLPTHPEHFEAPAIWGWELNVGRFMQFSGPIWDPLHYYYESVDKVIAAFEANPVSNDKPLVSVPEEMEHRFYPINAMKYFDTFSAKEFNRRVAKRVKPQSCLLRVEKDDYSAGLGYHPLPPEFEFEIDPFWFPELHPLNREHGLVPPEISDRIAPVIQPRVTISVFTPTIDVPSHAEWFKDENELFTPVEDPILNYPQLTRYLIPDMDIESIMSICAVPYLGDIGEKIKLPAPGWWLDDDGNQLDGPLQLEEIVPAAYDALWDLRQKGVEIVQFRHMVYQTNLPLYMLAVWFGWNIDRLQEAFEEWLKEPKPEDVTAPIEMREEEYAN
jgi:hypothetical protein